MIKWLFCVAPKVGSRWKLRGGNPFESYIVVVDMVKGSWIRYHFEKYSSGARQERSIYAFRALYREVKT